MVASDGFAEFLREQLAPLGRISMRRMFGKTGVFCDGFMLGMVRDNTLYFRSTTTIGRSSRKPSPFRLSTTRKRAIPSTSPFGARRSVCSTNPMSLSPGRARRWQRRSGLPRSGNERRESGNHSFGYRASMRVRRARVRAGSRFATLSRRLNSPAR